MKRFLGLALMLMGAVLLILPVGCSNNLPSSSTGAVASTSPSAPSTVGYNMTEVWYTNYAGANYNYSYYPWGLGILPNGNLAVLDYENHVVFTTSPNGEPNNGSGVSAISTFGANNLSTEPYGMTVDSHGNIWVADSYNYRIVEMAQNGNIIAKFGQYGTDGKNGDFKWPDGVAFDSKGNIYVLDYYTGVQVFDSGFNYKTSWGNGSFYYPYGGIASDGTNIFIADTYDYQLKKYSAKGQLLKAIGTYGTGESAFEFISGTTVDTKGNVYGVDYYSGLQKFDNNLNFITYVGIPSEVYGDGFYTATVDPTNGDVYATDYYSYLYKFVPKIRQ